MEKIGLIAGISGEVLTARLHERGYQVALVGGRPGESGMDVADEVLVCDLSRHEEVAAFFHQAGVRCILLGTGHAIAIYLAAYLEKQGFIFANNIQASLLAKDKIRYKEALQTAGILTPHFIRLMDASERSCARALATIGLPCVVKSGIDKILPQKASSPQELDAAIREVVATGSEALVEQYIMGVDTTVPLLADGETAKALMISYYSKAKACSLKGFKFSEEPEQQKLSADLERRVMSYCERAIKATDVCGLCRIDAIVTPKEDIYVLECNSVIVTGVHPNQLEYGLYFIQKEGLDFAGMLVDMSLKIFKKTEVNCAHE